MNSWSVAFARVKKELSLLTSSLPYEGMSAGQRKLMGREGQWTGGYTSENEWQSFRPK